MYFESPNTKFLQIFIITTTYIYFQSELVYISTPWRFYLISETEKI